MFKRIQVLLIVFLFCLVIVPPSFAYTGGLLNGLPLNLGPDQNTKIVERTQWTDNNESTAMGVDYAGGHDTVWYEFPSPVNIDSYKLKASIANAGIRLVFYNTSGSVIFSNTFPSVDGFKVSAAYSDVKKVAVFSTNSTYGIIINEFDVFGYADIEPSDPSTVNVKPLSSSSLDITWVDPPDAAFKEVRIYKDDILINTVAKGIQKFTVSNLSPLTTYNFKMVSVSLTGKVSSGVVASGTTLPKPLPSNVTITSYTVSHDSANLYFSATGAEMFEIYQDGVLKDTVISPVGSYLVTGLSPLTSYSFKVAAVNVSGSVYSSTVVVKTIAQPPSPSPFELELVEVLDKTIRVSFSTLNVDSYEVYRDGVLVTTLPSNSTGYIYQVSPFTNYKLWIVAVNQYGRTASGILDVTSLEELVAPSEAKLTLSKAYLDRVDLSVSVKKAKSIKFYRDGRLQNVISGDVKSYTDYTVEPDKTYIYRFVAENQVGSVTSPDLSVKTLKPPSTEYPKVQIIPGSRSFFSSMDFTIVSDDPDASLFYSFDGNDWISYSKPVTIKDSRDVYAKAVNVLGNESSIVVAQYHFKENPKVYLGIDLTDVANAGERHFSFLWPIIAFCVGVVAAIVYGKQIRDMFGS